MNPATESPPALAAAIPSGDRVTEIDVYYDWLRQGVAEIGGKRFLFSEYGFVPGRDALLYLFIENPPQTAEERANFVAEVNAGLRQPSFYGLGQTGGFGECRIDEPGDWQIFWKPVSSDETLQLRKVIDADRPASQSGNPDMNDPHSSTPSALSADEATRLIGNWSDADNERVPLRVLHLLKSTSDKPFRLGVQQKLIDDDFLVRFEELRRSVAPHQLEWFDSAVGTG